ncbi:MAG: Gfo/Idh/MocA family oxidoreductase [Planctomycetes bacterium]|nr:Gfo/Idh/MocA family oxidoreductase [Planctomycetota bacterium]
MTVPLRIGVIGMGFMGRTHAAAYQAAASAGFPCTLSTVCDPDASRLTPCGPAMGNLATGANTDLYDPSRVLATTDVDAALAACDVVSICTYTDSHVSLAERALNAGKHVLVEKPVSLHADEIERLAALAQKSKGLCMPAMCMRFWPGWDWLRERIRDGAYGPVRSATFQRLGSGPNWSAGFYKDVSRSGGALFDLHIHDTDFIVWCFGAPKQVHSGGDAMHVTTLYKFDAGPAHVSAEGAWDLSPAAGFRMRYVVNFERATAEFDLSKPKPLTLHTADASTPVDLSPLSGYDGEVRHLLMAIAHGSRDLNATLADAAVVAKVLEQERRAVAG